MWWVYCFNIQVLLGSFLFSAAPIIPEDKPEDWANIEMPSKSYFAGFSPPQNAAKWNQARLDAAEGKQILLQKVMDQILYSGEVISGDIYFGW